MKFYWRTRVIVSGGLLAGGMIAAAFWQWDRHLQKQAYIEKLKQNIAAPIADFVELADGSDTLLEQLEYRRVRAQGFYDFEHEMLLRNRKYGETPGVHVITPLKLDGSDQHVLISRGFMPLSRALPETRKQFQKDPRTSFVGLVKKSMRQKFLAPSDPVAGADNPWVDAWLRINIPEMQRQLPYPVLPIYLEVMGPTEADAAQAKIVVSHSGRDEIFYLQGRAQLVQSSNTEPDLKYPIPAFDTVAPPDIHLGYVYEWSFMALITIIATIVLLLRPGRKTFRQDQRSAV